MNSIIPSGDISASALSAERQRLDVIAQNIANVNTTKGPDGQPYRRREVVFDEMVNSANPTEGAGVKVAEVTQSNREPIKMYMPDHPHADKDGMVSFPNINIVEEMADMVTASRSYEANLQSFRVGRQMFRDSLDMGTSK